MNKTLEKLASEGNLRTLSDATVSQRYIKIENKQYINLSSNDYLSLGDISLQQQFFAQTDLSTAFLMSNPSSRLMTGNTHYYKELEQYIASLYGKKQALVLSSGFMLNSGSLPALTTSDDYIIADKLVHASLIDGMKQCDCPFARFRHNDTTHLKKLLETTLCKGDIYVVLESIYSMDGDIAPLLEIVELKRQYGFKIYLDEAHAFGVRGAQGLGIAEQEGLLSEIDYVVVTMGKAAVSQGAFIVCDDTSKALMINNMRTLIFSTALPPISLLWSYFIVREMVKMASRRKQFYTMCEKFCHRVEEITGVVTVVSHIIPIIIGDNDRTLLLAQKLRNEGFWVTAIRPPTVAKGTSRLRISLCAGLKDAEIENFLKILQNNLN